MVSSIQHFSSVFFCVTASIQSKHPKSSFNKTLTLAVGGRYDGLLALFRKPSSGSTPAAGPQSATGVSFSFALLLAVIREEPDVAPPVSSDVYIASLGHHINLKEALHLLHRLWSLNISADISYDPVQSLEDLHDFCKQQSISVLVLLKDSEEDTGRIHILDTASLSGRWTERRMPLGEIPDVLLQLIRENEDLRVGEGGGGGGDPGSSVSSGSSSGSHHPAPSKAYHLDIKFLMEDPKNKLAPNDKRRSEIRINSKVTATLSAQFRTTAPLVVVATELPLSVVKCIAAYLDLSVDEQKTVGALQVITEKHQVNSTIRRMVNG
jgi:hypothetical protein